MSEPTRIVPLKMPTVMPFRPGDSPFQGKGGLYSGMKAYIERVVPGGLEAVYSHVKDPEIVTFLSQNFKTATWYDLVPIPFINQAIAAARGISVTDHIIEANRYAVEYNSGALYMTFLKVITARRLALTLPKAATLLHSFGSAKTIVMGPTHVRALRYGMPEVLVWWSCLSIGTFIHVMLEKNGVEEPNVQWAAPRETGERAGQRLYALTADISWK